MGRRLWTFVISLAIYFALTNDFTMSELLMGLVIAAIVSLAMGAVLPTRRWSIRRVFKGIALAVAYIPYFLWRVLLANLDVAWRVVQPKIPLNPGFVRVPTKVKSDLGKLFLANSITLTPGTLTLDVDNDELLVHWIDTKTTDSGSLHETIAQPLERFVGGIFG